MKTTLEELLSEILLVLEDNAPYSIPACVVAAFLATPIILLIATMAVFGYWKDKN